MVITLKDSAEYAVRAAFDSNQSPGKFRIPLAASTFTADDIVEALDSLLELRLTMGVKTLRFEEAWAKYVGTVGSVLTNSGSSAEDLAFYTLATAGHLKAKDEVITSAVTFPSSVNAIVHAGAKPVFVDVDLETLDLQPNLVEKAMGAKTKAILPVHFMGNPCDMPYIMELIERSEVFVVEDCAESHGAMVGNQQVGSMGDMGIFSFFFSHHISTIEGGSLVSDNSDFIDIAKSLRSYGWIRTLSKERQEQLKQANGHIDPRHLYIHPGYNFKPTEINAALGLHQIQRIESIIDAKRSNARFLTKRLSQVPHLEDYIVLPTERPRTRHSWLGYPVVAKDTAPFDKFYIMSFLEKRGIETRQLEAGNVLDQPFSKEYTYRVSGTLTNTGTVMRGGLFFGDYHTMTQQDLEYIVEVFEELIDSVRRPL